MRAEIIKKAASAAIALMMIGIAPYVYPGGMKMLDITILASAAGNSADFDKNTGTLTLKAGNVTKDDVQAYKKTAKRIIAEKGAILPENCRRLFNGFRAVTEIDLTKADTSKVTNMSDMFMDCESLGSVNLSGTDTSKVTTMQSMFIRCEALENVDLTGINTSALIDTESMFEDCKNLKTLDLSYFDTSKIEYWSCMFKGCSSLTTIYASDKWTGVRDTYVTTWLLEPIFEGCNVIKGGNGTTYDADAKDDKIYARTDKKGEPGYLTYKAISVVQAPESISYKLISHDKVTLKWNTAEGTKKYILYRFNPKTGKYSKIGETTKTKCTLKKLKADTEYTYAVQAVSKESKSGLCKVTFRTPKK